MVITGSVSFRVADEQRELGPGATWNIPADVPHEVRAGPEGAVVIDVFSPTRQEDWRGLERRSHARPSGPRGHGEVRPAHSNVRPLPPQGTPTQTRVEEGPTRKPAADRSVVAPPGSVSLGHWYHGIPPQGRARGFQRRGCRMRSRLCRGSPEA